MGWIGQVTPTTEGWDGAETANAASAAAEASLRAIGDADDMLRSAMASGRREGLVKAVDEARRLGLSSALVDKV